MALPASHLPIEQPLDVDEQCAERSAYVNEQLPMEQQIDVDDEQALCTSNSKSLIL